MLDTHESAVLKRTTLAREGYLTDFDAQFEIANNPALPAGLRAFAQDHVLPALLARVSAGGLPANHYIGEIVSTRQPITNGGLTLRNFRNTAGLGGALSVLVETRLDPHHDHFASYRNIAVRVQRQQLCIRSFLAEVHTRRAAILAHTAAARAALKPPHADAVCRLRARTRITRPSPCRCAGWTRARWSRSALPIIAGW